MRAGASLPTCVVAAMTLAAPASSAEEAPGPLARLNDLDRGIADLVRRRADLVDLREDLDFELSRAGLRGRQAEAAGERVQRQRLLRLATLHRQGRSLSASIALGPRSVQALRARHLALAAVISHDRQIAEHHLARAGALAAAAEQGDKVRRRLNALTESLNVLEASLASGRADRQALLRSVAEDPRIARQAGRELEDGRRRLSDALGARPMALPDLPFVLGKGRLPMPTPGAIVAAYGERRDGRFGPAVRNEGIDVTAPPGAEVTAVWGGHASFADWLPGYGLVVILDHDQGWHTVYGHLAHASIERGVRVAAGDRLGEVGATGAWGPPRLHFEVRHGTRSEDPADWLADLGR